MSEFVLARDEAGLVRADGVRRSDGAWVPADDANPHWRAYLAWCALGGVAVAEPLDLRGHASRRLVALRDGGVMVAGVRVKTDAESRGLIDGADALCQRDPDAVLDFKAASGWVRLDAATMRAIALAVGRWVQACYSTYRTVSDAIAADTITSAAQIDAAFAALERPE